jgi:hypothetical protein
MTRYLTIAIWIVFACARTNAAPVARYLQVIVSGANDIGNPVCSGSLVFDMTQEQLYNGGYYIAENSCGITADVAAYRESGMKFELLFNLRSITNDQGVWMSGSTYALNYFNGRQTGLGEKTSVEKKLPLGQKVLVCSYALEDGREVTLHVSASVECPPSSTDCGKNAVTLVSTVLNDGKVFSKSSSARRLLAESMEFRPGLEATGAGVGSPKLDYSVLVQIPGASRALKEATPCQVVFQRAYRITSLQMEKTDKQVAVNYTSKNTMDVVLEPGKELRLVFPPDTPPVEGFDIEDTLIIVPR